MGAGLGGGSGNAATALWAANELSGRLATEEQLREWAGEIGSDISFFFSTGCAYCTGRGEIVRDVPPPIALSKPFLLVKPVEECPTKDIYKNFVLAEASKASPEGLLAAIQAAGKVTPDTCINDLEPPAFKVVPSLKLLKERLVATTKGRCDAVFMSGSGSTIVVAGSDNVPSFLYDEEGYEKVFISGEHATTPMDEHIATPMDDVHALPSGVNSKCVCCPPPACYVCPSASNPQSRHALYHAWFSATILQKQPYSMCGLASCSLAPARHVIIKAARMVRARGQYAGPARWFGHRPHLVMGTSP
eukprot:jgi/Mesvir1/17898/Mv12966-RA.2